MGGDYNHGIFNILAVYLYYRFDHEEGFLVATHLLSIA